MPGKDREKAWEQVQIKAFTAWVNSYLEKQDTRVENLQEDFCDGVRLVQFLEIMTGDSLGRYNKNPPSRTHRFQNVTIALDYIVGKLEVKLVGIGSEDFVDGRLKLILGMLWSLFRKVRLSSFAEGGNAKEQEEGLLNWVRKMTEGYGGVNITNWKESFADGLAFSALIHQFDPEKMDYGALDHDQHTENLTSAFDIAEEVLGIPKLLDVDDMVNKQPDERSVVLYTSLFFHAFVTNEEKLKIRGEVKAVESQLDNLKAGIAEKDEELAAAARRRGELEGKIGELEGELNDARGQISDLNDKNKALQDQITDLNKLLADEREKNSERCKFLEEKIKILSELLEENEKDKSSGDAALQANLDELERERAEKEALAAKADGLEADGAAKDAELEAERKRRQRMQHELEDLKKKVAKEIARRRQKAQALAELQKELQALKKKAIVEGKARRGLDVLKKNLEEHLEDMYQWRDLHQYELADKKSEFNLEEVLGQISQKSFEEQLDILNDKMQAENQNLARIIKLKDTQAEIKETVEKEGWLYMKASKKQKEWKKQWFVLRASNLMYFKDEKADRPLGDIPLAECQMIALKAEKVEDPNSPIKKFFITRVAVGERSVYLGFTSLKEKSSWMLPLKNKMQHHMYIRAVEKTSSRPDTRILALFSARDIKACYLDNNLVPTEGMEAVTNTLSLHDTLDTVHMMNAELTDAACASLIDVLPKWKLKQLTLSHNKLSGAGAAAIVKALAAAPNEVLEVLELNNNAIDDAGAAAIAEALPQLQKLKTLNLDGNAIGNAGASALAGALGGASVPSLHLADNKIGNEGAAALASMIAKSPVITAVHLNGNQIGDDGASKIAAALADNVVVESLDLSSNALGNAGALAMRSLLDSNKSIQSIKLSSNKGVTGGADLAALSNAEGFTFPDLAFNRVL